MKGLKDLLLLGDPRLYQVCDPVLKSELPLVENWVTDLHNTMQEIRYKYKFGRAIAVPQLGIMKRLIINLSSGSLSKIYFAFFKTCCLVCTFTSATQYH